MYLAYSFGRFALSPILPCHAERSERPVAEGRKVLANIVFPSVPSLRSA
jgi:hypothetical protein